MPGIAGIISLNAVQDTRVLSGSMVEALAHEATDDTGHIVEPRLGVAAGWARRQETGEPSPICSTTDGALSLLLYGRLLPEPGEIERLRFMGRAEADHVNGWVLARYEALGEAFLESLNGLFCGLLIDRRQGKVHLFTDRYGLERLYVHENSKAVYFASEAKAILGVVPETRSFDTDGVSQFLAYGTTYGERTLFRGVRVLPGAACWTFEKNQCRKWSYFNPKQWEGQERLKRSEFTEELGGVLRRIVPLYSSLAGRLGISLTAGLDTRMLMACLPADPDRHVCFTYSGQEIDPLDAHLSTLVANECGLTHHVLRIQKDFFESFNSLAESTVFTTDGNCDILGTHEIYMSRLARKLAPCRLTGNYGSEILRGVSTLKPLGLSDGLITSSLEASVQAALGDTQLQGGHPVTFAAFKETPWNLFGSLQAGRTEIGCRTPYLDNEFVKLAYRAPVQSEQSGRQVCERVVQQQHPGLAVIPTDMGYLGGDDRLAKYMRRIKAKAAFKCDYMYSTGLPNVLTPLESLFTGTMKRLGLLGLHKHLTYRTWFQSELSAWLRERLNDAGVRSSPLWNTSAVVRLGEDHIQGRRNNLLEINAVLTLAIVEERLLKKCVRSDEFSG
jgi:asparagine synthase (glutamine-hydrolysing)